MSAAPRASELSQQHPQLRGLYAPGQQRHHPWPRPSNKARDLRNEVNGASARYSYGSIGSIHLLEGAPAGAAGAASSATARWRGGRKHAGGARR